MSSTATALPAGLTAGTWTIDASHSEAAFTVRHAGISKVRGTVAVTDGAITVGDDLAGTSVSVTLDPATVTTATETLATTLKRPTVAAMRPRVELPSTSGPNTGISSQDCALRRSVRPNMATPPNQTEAATR